jgi:endonuclease/exonuclease/phosphatase family metal-dependent hydrolase
LLFADGIAAKGAIHVRLRLLPEEDPKNELDVYVTHLESRNVTFRNHQYRAFGQFIGKYSDSSRPVLILGDLNINGDKQAQDNERSQYNKMLISLREQLPDHEITDVWVQHGEGEGVTADWDEEDGGNRIDYVLIGNPKGRTPTLQPQSIRVNKYPDEYVGTLSDHAAVEVEFKWQTQ